MDDYSPKFYISYITVNTYINNNVLEFDTRVNIV